MAVIELVDRDPNAKKVDIKKDPQASEKSSFLAKPKGSDKKTKSAIARFIELSLENSYVA